MGNLLQGFDLLGVEPGAVANLVLTELGVGAADLQASLTAPTVGEYVPRVAATASPGVLRTYGPYWQRAQ